MTENKIVIYFKGDVTEYEVPKKVIAGIMMILDEAINCDAIDWMSVVSERGEEDGRLNKQTVRTPQSV